MRNTHTRWEVGEHLRTRKDVRMQLEACAGEDPDIGSLNSASRGDIARTQNMTRLAPEICKTRKGLYMALSENGNPTFATVIRIARASGMQVRIAIQAQLRSQRIQQPPALSESVQDPPMPALVRKLRSDTSY